MDWTFSEEQQAVADLAGQILGDKLTHERLKAIERSDGAWATDEWAALAEAGLVGLAVPVEHGGAGLGLFEACLVAEQVGRTVAPLPYGPSVLSALAIGRFGTPDQQAAWLPGLATGDIVMAVALTEGPSGMATTRPTITAIPDGDGWIVSGSTRFVAWAQHASRVVVPVATTDGTVLVLLDPSSPGVTLAPLATTNGEPQADLTMVEVSVAAVDVLGADDDAADDPVTWLADLATVVVCATQAGVVGRAVELIGTYTSERHQFGSPIATFQAVAHRAADAYIDATAVRFTFWHATWRLDAGLPAADALDVAKYWAAEGGQRVVHAAQHLHGGIGVDRDYPLHRYFLWAKVLELHLGGASERLVELGRRIAAAPGWHVQPLP